MQKRIDSVRTLTPNLSTRQKCRLLGVHRSTVYYEKQMVIHPDDQNVMQEIREIYGPRPFLGYRRIGYFLRQKGYAINNKRVLRVVRQMGLQAVYPKINLSKRRQEDMVFPYLLHLNPPQRPNDVWCVDITYIKTSVGWVYLVALIDVVSRKVMGFDVSPFLETRSALEALEMALKTGHTPRIINSDQGCQFTSQAWVWRLVEEKIEISMDGKGRCIDNIMIERFWRTIKWEEVYLKTYDSVPEARAEIGAYIAWYNTRRPHQSLGYRTPDEAFDAGRSPEESGDKSEKSPGQEMRKPLTYPPLSPRPTTSSRRKKSLEEGEIENTLSLKSAA